MAEPLLKVVIETVARHYATDPSTLIGKDRQGSIVLVRQTAMYVARLVGNFSYPQIGAAFRRDHSTVIHACKKAAHRTTNRPLYAEEVDSLVKEIQGAGLTGRAVVVRHEILELIQKRLEQGLYGRTLEEAVDRILCAYFQRETS